jgi:ATP-binding cassette, subfamily B, bacterial
MDIKLASNKLFEHINADREDIYSIYFYAILSGILQLSVPLGIQTIIGFVMGASVVTSIYVLIFLVLLGVALVGVLEINQMRIIEKIQQNIFSRHAFVFAKSVPKMNRYHVDQFYMPARVNHFFETINLQKGFTKLLLEVPKASIQILFGFILLSFYHPLFILFDLMLLAILFLIIRMSGNSGVTSSYQESNHKYLVVAWLEDIARSIPIFKFGSMNNLAVSNTDRHTTHYIGARTKHFKVLLWQYKLVVVFEVLISGAMLITGVYLLIHQQLNIGEFIAAEIVILTIIGAVQKLIANLDSVYDVLIAVYKLAGIAEAPTDPNGQNHFTANDKGISLKINHLSFNYPEQPQLFDRLNLEVDHNQKVAIIGSEVSGKNTLLRLLSLQYFDFTGEYMIEGIPSRKYNLDTLRPHVSYYTGKPEIFTGTLLENVTLNSEDKQAVSKVLELAGKLGFNRFLEGFSDGFDTRLLPEGKRTSGRQLQQIMLLRALYGHPKLICLHEPWRDFDPQIQESIKDYLLNLQNTTIIVATSETEFATQCDKAFVLQNGRLQHIN